MATYNVILKDRDDYDICADLVDGMTAAKARAKYLLTDAFAKSIETTHATLGTCRVEVQAADTGVCLWDASAKKGRAS